MAEAPALGEPVPVLASQSLAVLQLAGLWQLVFSLLPDPIHG